MDRRHARAGLCGDDGEAAVRLDGREQKRAGAGEAEAVLALERLAGDGAGDVLGHVPLVEGAHGHEAAPLGDGPRPHATPAQAELLQCRLDARVEDGVGPAVEWEAPLERGHAEAARAARHEERDPGAGARVAEGVGRLYVADGVAARAAR